MNDVYMSGFVRKFERESTEMMDFEMETKGRENGFLREAVRFENMNDFCLK